MITAGGLGWYAFLPESAKAVLASAAVLNVLVALLFALTAAVFVLLFLGPYKNPGWLSPGFSIALCLFGVAAFSTSEFIREAVRKPYVVYNVVLGNQVYPSEVATLREKGYLEGGTWTKQFVKVHYPQVMVDGRVDSKRLLSLPPASQAALGEVIYQYHCNDCHATTAGYSAVAPLLRGSSRRNIQLMIEHLEERFFMPPWAGTPEEAELLTAYLVKLAPPRPGGMIPVAQRKEAR